MLGLLREVPLFAGIAVFVGVAAPWYVMIMLRNPDFASSFFIEKVGMSLFSSEADHTGEPLLYYVAVVAVGFLPWSLLLPSALARGWRR